MVGFEGLHGESGLESCQARQVHQLLSHEPLAAPLALVLIAVAGATYLVYLGVGIVRTSGRAEPPADTSLDVVASGGPAPNGARESSARRLLWRGVGVSCLNPKSLVLFVAFLPQFVRPSAPWPVAVQLAVLGLLWAAIGAVFYTALGVTAQRIIGPRPAPWHSYPG